MKIISKVKLAFIKLVFRIRSRSVVLCLHSIGDSGLNRQTFEQLIDLFVDLGYKFPDPSNIATMPSSKNVIFTFDDGYSDNIDIYESVLRKYNIKPVVFVVTDFIQGRISIDETKRFGLKPLVNITTEQILQYKDRVLFAYHTKSHDNLFEVQLEEYRASFSRDISKFRKLIGDSSPLLFAYPFGYLPKDRADFESILSNEGVNFAFTTRWGTVNTTKRFYINRVVVGDRDSVLKIVLKVSGVLDLYSRIKWRGAMYD
ncbi:polysaccharide deacetylase family protein [Vibrio cyclitrophicus]